jgi:alginate O-acetyltransferase complex protein AlgI
MLFNSFSFLGAFLPVVVAGYWILRSRFGHQAGQAFLLLSSLFFYGYAKPSYLPLLLGSIVANWAFGVWMGSINGNTDEGEAKRGKILWLGIATNVAFLSSFKYVNFFFRHLPYVGAHGLLLPNWAAPLGISFFTFTQLMYLVDTCQGLNEPNSLFDHATLVSMFPYVAAGPLVRSSSIVPQFRKPATSSASWELGCRGLFLFTLGLAKKVILADAFAHIADIGFGSTDEFSTLEAWIFAVFYAFQIYYDFSGYSDMAVGCAWMLGIDIPQNFNRPYVSQSMSEFWTRWHISLSNDIRVRCSGGDVHRGIVARRGVDVHHLGNAARCSAGREPDLEEEKAAYARLAGLAADLQFCGDHAGVLPLSKRAGGAAHAA